MSKWLRLENSCLVKFVHFRWIHELYSSQKNTILIRSTKLRAYFTTKFFNHKAKAATNLVLADKHQKTICNGCPT